MKSRTRVEILALMALMLCGWARAANPGGLLDDDERKLGKGRPKPGELSEPMKPNEGLAPQKERMREPERLPRREARPRPEPSEPKQTLKRESIRSEEKPKAVKEPRQRPKDADLSPAFQKEKADRPRAGVIAREKAQSRIKKLGIKDAPKPLERSRIMDAGKTRSQIKAPDRGPKGERLTQKMLPPKKIYDPRIKAQMSVFASPSRQSQMQQQSQTETTPNHYYWHEDGGYRYCHYYDPYGYHWYGWYYDDYFFWARFYGDTWWFYDPFYFRWCFWYDGWWWWQDPFYQSGIYLYFDGRYLMY